MGMATAIKPWRSDAQAWFLFDAKARRDEDAYRAAALALFLRERDAIVDRLSAASPFPVDAPFALSEPYLSAVLLFIAADYALGGRYHTAWRNRFAPLLRRTFGAGARGVVGIRFNLDNPRARQAIEHRALNLAGNVSASSMERVRAVLAQARTDGVGVAEIAKRIRGDAFSGTVSRSRATTIARTETVGALNEGQHVAAVQSGTMQSKRWLSQQDGRVRDSHRGAESVGWIPLSGLYPNGLPYPHAPGAPAEEVVNCRCTELYSDLSPAEANRP